MRFFISGEGDINASEAFRETRAIVETKLNQFCADSDHGQAVKEIAIIPIMLRRDWAADRNERRLFQRKTCQADYRLKIDFDAFMNGDPRDRELLLVQNILTSVSDLARKTGKRFRGSELKRDIVALFDSPTDSMLQ